MDWYPLAAVCVCVCLCEAWHLSEMLNAGFDHLLHNVLNESWFPLIVVEYLSRTKNVFFMLLNT